MERSKAVPGVCQIDTVVVPFICPRIMVQISITLQIPAACSYITDMVQHINFDKAYVFLFQQHSDKTQLAS